MALRSLGTSGSVTPPANCASAEGLEAFQRSLAFKGTTTSLTSGLPRRETWTQFPTLVSVPLSCKTRVLRRYDVVHPPMTAFGSVAALGIAPLAVTLLKGSWSAIVFTFIPERSSTPPPLLPGG